MPFSCFVPFRSRNSIWTVELDCIRSKPTDNPASSASNVIKQGLDALSFEILEGCVNLMHKHEVRPQVISLLPSSPLKSQVPQPQLSHSAALQDPNLQAEAIYAISRLTAASSGMAAAFGAVPGSVECCLEVSITELRN